jgi:hypothetical protein
VESSCELGNEPPSSINFWETTEWLHNLWPLEWYSAPQRQIDRQNPLEHGKRNSYVSLRVHSVRRPFVVGGMNGLEKTCPTAALSTTNPT